MNQSSPDGPALGGRPAPDVNAMADGFWERFLQISPLSATLNGDTRYDDRLPDPGPEGRARARRWAEDMVATATSIPDDGLGVEDRITRDMLRVIGELHLVEDDQRLDTLQVVDQMGGPQTLLPQLCQFQSADTPERLEQFVARLHAYPAYMAANIELLREAQASGLTAPRIVAERTIAQLERMLSIPIDQAVVPAMVRVASEADREAVRATVRDEVYPADAAFLDALRGDYLAATRKQQGIWCAPNGEQIYRTQILHWTTLQLDPREIHRSGLHDLEDIERERRAISRAAGYGDDTKAYRAAIATDPANIPPTRDAIVGRAMDDIERAFAAAPSMFRRTPQASCRVMPVEEYKEADAPPAYYFPPSADGSRPGTYYVNAYDLPSRTYARLASITYHEAVPGHHFQISLETENTDLNRFRRFGSRLAGGAYVEGWGLYSERLADEMGLYRDEEERFSMLDMQAWRAARLVVDTGLHALQWTRRQSINQLLEAGLTETDAVVETDRYICWPAQALTYKVGQREIERLRREISDRDGSRFDLREFHDQLLGHGALPLVTLARELPNWVAQPV
ncbi:MAG TPA: DUF885 domain-containing protein [Candidatus Eisenbacteria bacterium]|nr:DUF885 domain-containing protein [Candidatus Eisenbacteria bacterium]